MTKISFKVLSKDEIGSLHNKLLHGSKKELAEYLKIAPSALSRHLNEGKFGYRMPQNIYNKIIEYVEQSKLNHGEIPAA